MPFQPSAALVLNAASGLLFIALGLAVHRMAPREPATRAFTVFALAFGVRCVLAYVGAMFITDDLRGALVYLAAAADVAFLAGIVLMALWFPRPLSPAERETGRWLLATLLPLGALFVLQVSVVNAASAEPLFPGISAFTATALVVEAVFYSLWTVALLGAGFLLVARFEAARDERERTQVALIAAAFGAIAGMSLGAFASLALGLPLLVVLAALWLRAAERVGGDPGRIARHVAWFGLAVVVVAMAVPLVLGWSGANGPQFGIAGVAVVALIAFGIVRHRLLGIDLKVHGTVTQRPPVAGESRAVDFYRRAIRTAWQDGAITHRERSLLRDLRAHLGLSAEHAERLEAEETPPSPRARAAHRRATREARR